MFVYVFVCLYVYVLFVYVCLCICLFVLFVCVFVCLCICLFICLFVYLCVCLFVYVLFICVCLYVCLFICLFVYLFVCVCAAVAGHAGVVRGRVPRQRQERRHHVGAVRHGDPAGDRHQQPPAPPQAAARHPGNGVAHQPLGPAHLPHRESPPSWPRPHHIWTYISIYCLYIYLRAVVQTKTMWLIVILIA